MSKSTLDAIKLLVVLLTASIPSYFSYKSVQSQADSGYKTLVASVQELHGIVEAQGKQIQAQRLELAELRGAVSTVSRSSVIRAPVATGVAAPPAPNTKFTALPSDLEGVQQQQQRLQQFQQLQQLQAVQRLSRSSEPLPANPQEQHQ